MIGIMPSMDICLQLCAFGLSLFLFPVAFGCIDGKRGGGVCNVWNKESLEHIFVFNEAVILSFTIKFLANFKFFC